MVEVAELAGVSQATVSLVLNGVPNARVSKTTRRRVIEAAETLGRGRRVEWIPGWRVDAPADRVVPKHFHMVVAHGRKHGGG